MTVAGTTAARSTLALGVACVAACAVDAPTFTGFDDASVDAATDAATDAPPDAPDAGPDAPLGPTVTAAAIPLRVAVNDAVALTFTIAAPAATAVTWSLQGSGGGGVFMPASGQVVTNSGGVAILATTYVAAALSGDHGYQLELGAGAVPYPFDVKVRALTPIGDATSYADNAGLLIAADTMYGQAVVAPATPVVVMRLGLVSHGPGFGGRMALYTDVGGEPFALVAQTTVEPIGTGAKEFRLVEPVPLAAGATYWLFGNFTAAAPIRRDATTNTAVRFEPRSTSAALADPMGGTSTTGQRRLNYYLLVAE